MGTILCIILFCYCITHFFIAPNVLAFYFKWAQFIFSIFLIFNKIMKNFCFFYSCFQLPSFLSFFFLLFCGLLFLFQPLVFSYLFLSFFYCCLFFDLLRSFIFWNNFFLLFGIMFLFLVFFSGMYLLHSSIIIFRNMFRHVLVSLPSNISFHWISSSSDLILSHSIFSSV